MNQTAIFNKTTIAGEIATESISVYSDASEILNIGEIPVIPIDDMVNEYGAPRLMLGLRKLSSTYTGSCVKVSGPGYTNIDIGFDENGNLIIMYSQPLRNQHM